MEQYLEAWRKLRGGGWIYPCTCSRKELSAVAQAPHEEGEPLYPGTCRGRLGEGASSPAGIHWRFRVPDGEVVELEDLGQGRQRFTAGTDFGDFVVWRRDNVPAYQLAVVVDDAAMKITEVVRGADLLLSTARQLLLWRALGEHPPAWFHCNLVRDQKGDRLAKRHDALSLRALRTSGLTPEQVRQMWVGQAGLTQQGTKKCEGGQ
jgi:glutamyl-tRNA synthetase